MSSVDLDCLFAAGNANRLDVIGWTFGRGEFNSAIFSTISYQALQSPVQAARELKAVLLVLWTPVLVDLG
jgi:hypothetical protein